MEATPPTIPPSPAPAAAANEYPVNVEIDYREPLSRWKTFFRPILAIPIAIVLWLLSPAVIFSTGLMVVFRRKYPKWWFDYNREYTAFTLRFAAYELLLDDRYPSTDDPQGVKLEMAEPRELNRWLPLVKWLLLLPHYIVLAFIYIGAVFAVIFAFFAILFTGRYPRGLHGFAVGVLRWSLRVNAYGFLLVTDRYPPFRLGP